MAAPRRPALTLEIGLVLGLLLLAMVVFATEKLPVDLTTILALFLLVVARVVTPAEAIAGFYDPIILILIGIFVISAALVRTGIAEAVGRLVSRMTGGGARPALGALLGAVAVSSAWMNNTSVTPVFIPPAIGLAQRLRLSPSKLLMPIAYASMLGGTCTLIGTSTNVAASGVLKRQGLAPLGMFELTPVGIVMALAGLAYLLTVGLRLMPDRRPRSLEDEYHIKEYLSEVVVMPGSPMADRPLAESGLGSALDLTVLAIHRSGEPDIVSPGPDAVLREGDLLVVQGGARQIAKVKKTRGIEVRADLHPTEAGLTSDQVRLVEVMPMPNSDLLGRTLKEVNFRARFGVTAIGFCRAGETLASKVGRVRMRLGDVLLVQGRKDAIARLGRSPELELLEDVTHFLFRPTKGLLAVGLFAAGIVAGTTGLMPLAMAILLAAVLVVATRCVPWEDVYRLIYWRMLVLIGGMSAFGTAMRNSGTDTYLADLVVGLLAPWGVIALLGGFFIMTVLLTQPMSNAAAALVVLPVALAAAVSLGLNPRTFAVTVTLAASCSFITPLEPSCLMVFGPGRYRFRDFIVAGSPLTLLMMAVALLMIPRLWPV